MDIHHVKHAQHAVGVLMKANVALLPQILFARPIPPVFRFTRGVTMAILLALPVLPVNKVIHSTMLARLLQTHIAFLQVHV